MYANQLNKEKRLSFQIVFFLAVGKHYSISERKMNFMLNKT